MADLYIKAKRYDDALRFIDSLDAMNAEKSQKYRERIMKKLKK